MADTKQQQIIDAVIAALSTISQAAGYRTDIGATVSDWGTAPVEETALTWVEVRDRDLRRSDQAGSIGQFRWDMLVDIVITIKAGADTARELRRALADVYQLAKANQRWGGLGQATAQPEGHTLDIDQAAERIGTATVQLVITYDSPQWEF